MSVDEKPELLLEVKDNEVPFEKYLSPEEKLRLEEQARIEEGLYIPKLLVSGSESSGTEILLVNFRIPHYSVDFNLNAIITSQWKARWPNGLCVRLRIDRS